MSICKEEIKKKNRLYIKYGHYLVYKSFKNK